VCGRRCFVTKLSVVSSQFSVLRSRSSVEFMLVGVVIFPV
jgi:hypothetical protein